MATGQRVLKLQPCGGLAGLGKSPSKKNALPLLLDKRIGHRHCREQRLGIGMQRVGVQRIAVGQLHDLSQVHHRHTIADMAHHAQVVGDEDISQAQFFLQVFQQVDHLGLNGDIQRGNRLITNDQIRVQGQRARQPDALPLPAGKLVWIAVLETGLRPTSISSSSTRS